MVSCSILDCSAPSRSRGWCSSHYAHWWRTGSPTPVGRPTGPLCPTGDDRFWEKVDKRGPDECWEWNAGRQFGYRYGKFHVGTIAGRKVSVGAHRHSYALINGPIPDGMWVLHRCDNPPCVNPAHLFLGTALVNARDRDEKGRGARNRREPKTHCKHGHAMSGDNLRIHWRPRERYFARICIACMADAGRRRAERSRNMIRS